MAGDDPAIHWRNPASISEGRMMSLYEKYLKPGDFVQVMREGGSAYGEVIEIDDHTVAMVELDHKSTVLISLDDPKLISVITGDFARENYTKASEEQPAHKMLGEMLEQALSDGPSKRASA